MNPIGNRKAVAILAATVLIAHLLIIPMVAFTKLSLDASSFTKFYLISAALLVLLFYVRWRGMPYFGNVLFLLVAGMTATIPVLISTYAAASLDMPLADERLMAMDAALGFDWRAFIGFIDQQPLLVPLLQYGYDSLGPQLLLLPCVLVLLGKPVRGYAVVFAYLILCIASSLISIWYPALGTYVSYDVATNTLANINAHYGFLFLEQFNQVRDATAFTLELSTAAGIITYPSVHAGVAVLCAWGAWGSRWLRYPFLLANLIMLTSAISHSNHYLVDVVAGAGLAAVAIVLATWVFFVPASSEVGFRFRLPRRQGSTARLPGAASG